MFPAAERVPAPLRVAGISIGFTALWLATNWLAAPRGPAAGVSPIYPGAGISWALLLALGARWAPALWFGPALFLYLFPPLLSAGAGAWSPAASAAYGLAYVAAYGLSAHLILRFTGRPCRLQTLRQLIGFTVGGLLAPALLSAVLFSFSVVTGRGTVDTRILSRLFLYFSGEAAGVFTVAPFLLIFGAPLLRLVPRDRQAEAPDGALGYRTLLEIAALGLLVPLLFAFAVEFMVRFEIHLFALCFLPLVFMGARHGVRATSIGLMFTNSLVVYLRGLLGWAPVLPMYDFRILLLAFSVSAFVVSAYVSEVRRTRSFLQESERRFRELLQNLSLIAVMLDRKGRVTFCNDYLLRLTGWSREQVYGTDWFNLAVPRGQREELRGIFRSAIQCEGFPVHYENSIVTKEGQERLIVWDNTVLRSPDGSIAGTASIGRDVTDERQLEEQYRQAQKLESLGRLAGGVAHDFNNLLTAVIGYAEMLLMDMGHADSNRGPIEEIRKAGNRAAELTRQLLAFGRKQVIRPEALSLNRTIEDIEKLLRRTIGEHIEFVTALDPELRSVNADPGQIQQVVMNLAVNSRDAMPQGGRLRLETRNLEIKDEPGGYRGLPAGLWVELAASDTGFGMDEETQKHIFEPFFTTKGAGKGTGLGLATVYGIVAQSRGHIFVESRPGEGTTFRVVLPAADGDAGALAREPTGDRARGTETILVVEDEPEVRSLAAAILEKQGYRVLQASRGEEGVRLCADFAGPIHLLITDVVMPGMTGRQLAEAFHLQRPGTRVLYMSGYPEPVLSEDGVLEPGFDYIQKPFSVTDLARCVRQALDQASAAE